LLLRLAGVPARVVAGFATGARVDGRYHVRDVDAHDWIEVYFQDYGWVPFNPTPAAAAATVPRRVDVLAPPEHRSGRVAAVTLLTALVLVAAGFRLRRRRHREAAPLGDVFLCLAHGTGTRVGTASTLSDLRAELEREIGPRTAALAGEVERARFAPGPPALPRRPYLRIAMALVADAGLLRAARICALARARRRAAGG
jgi:C4-dicarboxylate-specific signal transduction histidine kinase